MGQGRKEGDDVLGFFMADLVSWGCTYRDEVAMDFEEVPRLW